MCAGKLCVERFAESHRQSVSVSVEPVPALFGPEEGVHRANGLSSPIDLSHTIECDHLVRDREIHAAKFFGVQKVQGAWQIVGMDVEAEIFPVGKSTVGAG